MNPISILKIIGEMGFRFKESEIHQIVDYTTRMLDDGRIIMIFDENLPHAILFYSMTDNPDEFLKKGTWEYKSHDPFGKIIYLEKLVSRGWNKELRSKLESEIIKKYPQMTYGEWHRYARWGDKQVISKRRLQNV